MLLLGACLSGPSGASRSPSPSAAARGSAPASGSTNTPPSTGPASLVHCTTAIPAGDNMVIGTVVGDPVIVVRDIQDPANARNLCTIDAGAQSPQFVSATSVASETADMKIIKAGLGATSGTAVVATYHGGFGSGLYAVSPDGRSVSYMDGNQWHLAGPSGNRMLATLPAAPGRGASPDEDD